MKNCYNKIKIYCFIFRNPTPVIDQYITTTWHPATADNFYYLDIGDNLELLTSPDDDNILRDFE